MAFFISGLKSNVSKLPGGRVVVTVVFTAVFTTLGAVTFGVTLGLITGAVTAAGDFLAANLVFKKGTRFGKNGLFWCAGTVTQLLRKVKSLRYFGAFGRECSFKRVCDHFQPVIHSKSLSPAVAIDLLKHYPGPIEGADDYDEFMRWANRI
jgi:hypothetical protein